MKDNLFTFHKTVHGYRHMQEENPCQDSSVSYVDDGYHIISIADGHGDPACRRSDRGSRFAVDIAKKCLEDFAAVIISGDMPFEQPRQRSECMQQLTNTLISKWYGAVRNDLLNNEVTEDDLKEANRYEDAYKKGEYLEHLYGTTIIAALFVKNYLILIQQGDGRCDVFYADGSVDQPIPWDERCQGSTTTSMCDRDVFSRIRTKVINLDEKEVVACFIGSDGVEDSYYENEQTQLGTHRFYMDLMCKIHEYGIEKFDLYLDKMLPAFSKCGSMDDVSVAGIVDLEKTANLIDNYQLSVTKYDYSQSVRVALEEAKSKVISMSRKHGILAERIVVLEKDIEGAKFKRCSVLDKLDNLRIAREEQVVKVKQAKNDLDEYRKDSQRATSELEGKYSSLTIAIQHFIEDISNGGSIKEITYRKLLEQLLTYDQSISEEEKKEKILSERITELEGKLIDTKSEFDEYDKQFQNFKNEVEGYENEIANMDGEG